jgi:twitching motility protein PilT
MTATLAAVRFGETMHVARLQNASDVHITAGLPPVLRVDGELQMQPTVPVSFDEVQTIVSSLLDERALKRLENAGDVTVSYDDEEELGSARIHVYRTLTGVTLAIRLLRRGVPALESLHLPAVVSTFADRPQGLIIFAGPTGSGKSTALASIVDCINRAQSKHIVTIEDPVEYRHRANKSIVTQREVRRDVDSYAQAIYGALRSDPDVILVGEMRDPETMHAALTAAETGHLVLTTLHTGDAPQTVDRIIGAFGGALQEQVRIQLAQTLVAVVCMRLVPRSFAEGRRAAAEILIANNAVQALIRDAKSHQLRNVIATSRQSGMQTLEVHLNDLVARNEISLEAARAVASRPEEVRQTETVSF